MFKYIIVASDDLSCEKMVVMSVLLVAMLLFLLLLKQQPRSFHRACIYSSSSHIRRNLAVAF